MAARKETDDRVARIRAEWARERPDVNTAPQAIIGRLHRLAAVLTSELIGVFDTYGLTEGEFDIMCALRRAGEPYERAPHELAKTTMVTTGAVTKRLDHLEAAGVVHRTARAGDGRGKWARLTPKGVDLIDRAFPAHMENEARLLACLSSAQKQELEATLTHWLQALDSDD